MPAIPSLIDIALGARARTGRHGGARFQRPDATLRYGVHELQALDLYRADDMRPAPLVAFVHGGAWRFGDKARRAGDRKAVFCRREGWHFASLNFRQVPEVGVGQMADDVARAIALLIGQAGEHGIDRKRVVLMGHSSGAQLAALVGSDPRYLGAHGLGPESLAGVIAIDGAAYDARARSTGAAWLERRLIEPAFPPRDQAARAELSAALQSVRGANARAFLLLHAATCHSARQARALERGLAEAGTPVERHVFAGAGALAHVALSRRFGRDGHGPTEVARRWLAERFA